MLLAEVLKLKDLAEGDYITEPTQPVWNYHTLGVRRKSACRRLPPFLLAPQKAAAWRLKTHIWIELSAHVLSTSHFLGRCPRLI
jgi:hypothetical protein